MIKARVYYELKDNEGSFESISGITSLDDLAYQLSKACLSNSNEDQMYVTLDDITYKVMYIDPRNAIENVEDEEE